ncbi:MAG: response regulator [bacterium]|nr:response regulator [bacterium]
MQKKVVVVEDTEVVRALIVAYLRPYGCTVIEARNGIEGITAIREERPDLVLLDISMPEISGNDVLKLMRADATTRGIPVVMTTAQAAKDIVSEVVSQGVSAYLVKPITREVFDRAVGRILGPPVAPIRKAPAPKSEAAPAEPARREAPAAAAPPRPAPPAVSAPPATITVLVADESGRSLDSIRSALESHARVLTATNGREAVMRFDQERPAVTLLSLSLPDLDGWQTLAAIRGTGTEGGRILALVPEGETVDPARMEAAGFSGRLAKPINANDLVHTIRAAALEAGDDAADARVDWLDGIPVVVFPNPSLPAFARIVLGLPRVVQRLAQAGHDCMVVDLGGLEDTSSGIPRLVARMLAAAGANRMRAAAVASPAVAAGLEAIAETKVPYLRTRAEALDLLAARRTSHPASSAS